MNQTTLQSLTASFLCGVAFLAVTPVAGAGDEAPSGERIEQAVKEAKEVAREWTTRFQEWQSGKSKSTTYMGVIIESVPEVLRDYVDLPKGVGLLLSRIVKDGPAEKAGLVDNDILLKFDDQLVINYSQLSTLIDLKGPGATVPVKVLRKGKEMDFQVTLEERIRKGPQLLIPAAPEPPEPPQSPDVNAVPGPDDVGALENGIEEWIPGSVRVYIDDDEKLQVDLRDLKESVQDLQTKLRHVQILKNDVPGLVTEHGDMGARTTVVRIADKNINFSCKDGKVVLDSSEAGQNVMVWNADGQLIYEGDVPDDYETKLPPEAVKLIKTLKDSGSKLNLETGGKSIEIHLNDEEVDPVTWVQR